MSEEVARRLHGLFSPGRAWEAEKAETQSWYLEAANAMEAAIRFTDQALETSRAANTDRPNPSAQMRAPRR